MEQVNASNSSLSCSSVKCITTLGLNQQEDKLLYCIPWDRSEYIFLAFFLAFFGCIIFSCGANGFLFFVIVRYRQLLWQPQYILLKNISICGIGMNIVIAGVTLSSVLHQQTQIFGSWCIIQFCFLRIFFLNSQMTLALMAMERYIFICFGIHYLRLITVQNVSICIGLLWLLSGAVSFHGGLFLSQIQRGIQEPTSGLLCSAVTIKEHISFSWEEDMLFFGPPSVIMVVCILTFCFCYGSMYLATVRVTMALKRSNRRANRTVGLYFLFFLLQVTLNIISVILTVLGQKKQLPCLTITSIAVPMLMVIPYCIIPAFLIIRNPHIKQLLFCVRKCHFTCTAEVEVTEEQIVVEEVRCEAGDERQMDSEYMETPL